MNSFCEQPKKSFVCVLRWGRLWCCTALASYSPQFTQFSFYSSPEGKKFRSRRELKAFLLGNDLLLNADDFNFSVNGKGVAVEGRIAPLY
jgi:hypothetical protein